MPTEIMSPSSPTTPHSTPNVSSQASSPKTSTEDLTVEQIIEAARSTAKRAPSRGAWSVSLGIGALLWASFAPLDFGPLAWVALVPLLLLIRIPERTNWMYVATYGGGLTFFVPVLQWMRLGDPAMYVAWCALALYCAMYFPAFVWLSRVAVHRLSVPFVLAVPVTWVALEFVRAHLMTGFAWYFLGHTQYRFVELIQISDVTGAYGVSFLLAMCAAALAGLVPLSAFDRLRLLPPEGTQTAKFHSNQRAFVSVVAAVLVFSAVLTYGFVRRSQADFQPGPRVALVQGNFPTSLKHDPKEAGKIFNRHYRLTGKAVKLGHKPDLIIWPETMYRSPLLVVDDNLPAKQLRDLAPGVPIERWRAREVQEGLKALSEQAGASLIIGLDSAVASHDGLRHYNSAAFVQESVGMTARYDKMHRVPFGEYIPLREQIPWLQSLTPFSEGFGIAAGTKASVFPLGKHGVAPVICYEDTVPHLVRGIVNSAEQSHHPVHCLVNLSNDGWFHGSSELDQHLITAQFRAVECRVPIVRAVNTGISAFVDGDGVVVEPDVYFDGDNQGRESMRDSETGAYHKQLNAVLVHNIPIDHRQSLYVKYGDLFGGGCTFAGTFFLIVGFWPSRRKKLADWKPPVE
ncbi:MAG: apolipoprotein N-acyltransferase [Planctomycetaceae bacterium]|nr:apolipoprotein N-acyltransferase [Planctomycetaceae bacterium]